MYETKLKLMIHPKKFKRKPSSSEMGAIINNEITKHPRTLSVKSLAEELTRGKTITTGYLEAKSGRIRRQEEYWKSQQMVALDFDNERTIKDSNGKKIKVKDVTVTLEQALENEFIKKYAAFAYKTFSYTDSHPKFRVVFIFDKPLYNLQQCKNLILKLLELFPTADQQCKDGTRVFYGGTDLHVINYDNRLPTQITLWGDIKGLISIYPTKGSSLSETLNSDNLNVNNMYSNNKDKLNIIKSSSCNYLANNIELIKQLDINNLQKRIYQNLNKPYMQIILHNTHQVYDYLKKQDLKLFLGVNSNSVIDIFHDESSPSASIYQSETGSGHWMYRCHSTSSPFFGTILEVTQKLTKLKLSEVKNFLMKVYNIKIVENETQRQLREEIDAYKYILQSEVFPEMYPNVYKLFNRYGFFDDLYILLDLIKENLPANSDDPRLLFYHSIETLSKKFNKSTTNTGRRMNFFTFFRMIYKLDVSEVPRSILDIQRKNKFAKQHKYLNSTYEMKIYDYSFFAELDSLCKEWMSKGLTTKTMTYEGILRNFGREEADRVFPQDKGKEIPTLHEDIVRLIEKSTLNLIKLKGWATEKEVLEHVRLYFKGQKKLKEDLIKRCIGDMLDKYALERIQCTKQVKKEMNISEDQLSVSSFPKIIRKIERMEECI
ncbi:hypothetical protein [Metabacillus sp. 22489]|uniref:hypothetical protein n=1 Tax=Metabacillus sp. 22489 TaxID=3453928 RepID=UPI003F871FA8